MYGSPKTARTWALLIVAFFALPWVSPLSSAVRAEQRSITPPTLSLPLFSDFDGDHNVDRAELSAHGRAKRIYITLGTRRTKLLSFDSRDPDRGLLLSSDFDRDGDLDLIWISKNDPQQFVTWLGDGHGDFAKEREPADDANRRQALLNDASSDVTGAPAATDLIAVLQSTTLVGTLSSSDRLHVRTSADALPSTSSIPPSTRFVSVLHKRGPPSQHL